MRKNYIDVGCNRGQYSLQWRGIDEAYIYAFEPNQDLYAYLKQFESDKFKVFDYAVGSIEGITKFNIGENDATSSLKNFDKDYIHHKYSKQVDVNVVRLDNFCKQHEIDAIEHIKIDAQGSDLDVLHSLGEHIYKVKSIMIEAFINNDVNVYEDEVKESQVMDFLIPKGFVLVNRIVDGNYCDLLFHRQ